MLKILKKIVHDFLNDKTVIMKNKVFDEELGALTELQKLLIKDRFKYGFRDIVNEDEFRKRVIEVKNEIMKVYQG